MKISSWDKLQKTYPEINRKLIQMVKRGDEDAFKTLYDHYQPQLRAYAWGIMKSWELADDVAQEVFLRVWLKRKDLDPDLNFNSYLFKIAKNLVLRHFEKMARDERLKQEVLINSRRAHDETQNSMIFKDYRKILWSAIQGLPPQKKQVYILSRYEWKNNKEIANELNLSVKTVQNHLGLALEAIKEELRRWGDITLPLLLLILFL